MARARNIKPQFFISEQISDNCPLGRLLFIGMWTLADHKGDLEWKPKTIKIQILPWDECDIERLAINLDKSGLIRFYSDGERTYVNIPNFVKHQNPHKNEKEKGSDIPAYSEEMRQAVDLKGLTINRDKSRAEPEPSTSDPADSLLLNPESLKPLPETRNPPASAEPPPAPAKKYSEDDFAMACEFHESLVAEIPGFKQPNFETWAKDIRLMRERDKRHPEAIRAMWRFARLDDFWRTNILCPRTLREKFDKLTAKAISKKQAPYSGHRQSAAIVQFSSADYNRGINPDGSF